MGPALKVSLHLPDSRTTLGAGEKSQGMFAVPVVIAASGQPEIATDSVAGRFRPAPRELAAITLEPIEDPERRGRLAGVARATGARLSREEFRRCREAMVKRSTEAGLG